MPTPDELRTQVRSFVQTNPDASSDELTAFIKNTASPGRAPAREALDTGGGFLTTALEGEPLPSGKDVLPAAIRYGIPIGVGIATPSLSVPNMVIQAITSMGSEFAARRIEALENDPETDTLWQDLKASGTTGLLDLGVNAVTRGISGGLRSIGRKMFIPPEIPDEILIAQNILGDLPAKQAKGVRATLSRYLKFVNPKNRPFSLTFGQINGEEQRFISWLEGIARAGVGSRGVLRTFDLRNESAITDLVEQYVRSRGTKATGPEFAAFAKRIIGDVTSQGEMFVPVTAYRKFLYKQFTEALGDSGGTVDATALRNYLLESGNILSGLPDSIYGTLRASGLVPPLRAPSTATRKLTRTKTTKIGELDIDETSDITRTNLLTGDETRKAEAVTGTRLQHNIGETEITKETETIVGLTEEEVADEWSNLLVTDADEAIKMINKFWKDGDDSVNNVVGFMAKKLDTPFQKFLQTYQDAQGGKPLKALHDAADTFFKKEVNFMRNGAIRGLRKTLTENPSKALALLGGGTGETTARNTYDRLLFVRDALGFSAVTPRTGEALAKAVSKEGFPAGGEALKIMYDQAFLRPLRYSMITRNVDQFGRFEPNSFLKFLQENADTPEFFKEVFGGDEQIKAIRELMTALSVIQRAPKEKSIFIQLAQAGAIGGALGSASSAIFSDDPSLQSVGAAGAFGAGIAVMLGPYALSRMLTNTSLTRSFTDGLAKGARSGPFAMSLRKIAEMKYASTLFRESPSQDATTFYSTLPPEEPTALETRLGQRIP